MRHSGFCAPPHSFGELGRVQLSDSQGAEGVCVVLICLHLFCLLLARLPGVHSWKWVRSWEHHSWEHLFEPSRPHTGKEQSCKEMAVKVGLWNGIEQHPGSCGWAGEQCTLCSAQAGAVVQDCGLHCKWNSHHTHAQMCTSWCLLGDPSRLLLCVPLLPRREARGSARRQQDPSWRHDRVYQSGQPQGSRWVSVYNASQQSSAWAVTVAVLSEARAPCWHFCYCCFPGIHMHLERSSYLGWFLLPLSGLLCWDLPRHSNCSKRCRDVAPPSGALATAGVQGIENKAASCWLSRDLFQARLDPCPKQICSRLCSDLETVRAGKPFQLASSSPGWDVTVLS